MKARLFLSFYLVALSNFAQGTLTPSGAPGPTMKTLDQVEPRTPISSLPFVINTAGSYYVTTNLTYTGVGHGITINAGDVTIDLNGFALSGNNSSTQTNGIYVATTLNNISVRNGTVRLWKTGINAANSYGGIFSDLRLSSCTIAGLSTGGSAIIERCTGVSISGYAITAGNGCTIRDCVTETCTSGGVSCGNASTVVHCSFVQNTGPAIQTGSGCTITGCTVLNNTSTAISTAGHCTISGCTVANNSSVGIATAYSTVENCTVNSNNGDGIQAGASSQVLHNTTYGNGINNGSNIHMTGSYGRVEGNHATIGLYGIRVDGVGNVVVRNSAGGNNTNYVIPPSNVVGPSIAGSATLTNNNPHANYDY